MSAGRIGGIEGLVRALLSILIVGLLGIGTVYGQQTTPSDDDVDRAIHVCSLGTKTDAKVESGLSVLRRRILTGEGELSQSQIPSVIGSGVQTDAAKISLFEQMQKCVVEHVYGASPPPSPKADVELRFAYPQYPLLKVVNNSAATAENVKYSLIVWNIDRPYDINPLAPVVADVVGLIGPHNKTLDIDVFSVWTQRHLITSGMHLFGSASVECSNCTDGRTYWVDIIWGRSGWYSLFDRSGTPHLPAHPLINRYLGEHNRKPKPFVWTADPDRIIEKVNRGHQAIASYH